MDPANVPLPDTQDLAAELARQGTRQEQLSGMLQHIVAQLPALHLPLPPSYDGDPKACHGFLNQCTIHFELHAHQFVSDRARIAFIISLLSGEALAWDTPFWEQRDPVMSNFLEFLATFWKVFEDPGHASYVASSLLQLR